MAVTDKELMQMGRTNSICDSIESVKEALRTAYPNSRFMIVASDVHLDERGVPKRYEIASKHGDAKEMEVTAGRLAVTTPWLNDLCVDVCLGLIAGYRPAQIHAREAAQLHDASIDYARYRGLDTTGAEYCRDTSRWREELTGEQDPAVHRIGQKIDPMMLEQHITQVEEELRRLKAMRDAGTMQRTMAAEVKRLNRKGEFDRARRLEAELKEFVETARHKAEVRRKKLEALAKAREKLRQMRERKRNERPQPNFAKMAKRKRQQMAQRKAEKKKKRATGGEGSVRSCSQLLTTR